MRRFSVILCIITFCVSLSGCRYVRVTSADELIYSDWHIQNESGMRAELTFDTANLKACLLVTDIDNTTTEISGYFAVDKDKLYITSSVFKKTYVFGYKVYKDRLTLAYNNSEITFEAKNKEP